MWGKMSYSATISFKTIKADDIYGFFQNFKAEAIAHLEEIAEDNFIWSPYSKEERLDFDETLYRNEGYLK